MGGTVQGIALALTQFRYQQFDWSVGYPHDDKSPCFFVVMVCGKDVRHGDQQFDWSVGHCHDNRIPCFLVATVSGKGVRNAASGSSSLHEQR